MRMAMLAGIGLGLAFFTSMSVIILGEGNHTPLEVMPILAFITLLIFIGFCVMGLMSPLRGVLLIARQEKTLDFDFTKEMQRLKAGGSEYIDENWFVNVTSDRVLALRRDYIKKIIEYQIENRALTHLTFLSADNKEVKLLGNAIAIQEFHTWYTGIDTEERTLGEQPAKAPIPATA